MGAFKILSNHLHYIHSTDKKILVYVFIFFIVTKVFDTSIKNQLIRIGQYYIVHIFILYVDNNNSKVTLVLNKM